MLAAKCDSVSRLPGTCMMGGAEVTDLDVGSRTQACARAACILNLLAFPASKYLLITNSNLLCYLFEIFIIFNYACDCVWLCVHEPGWSFRQLPAV